jgi:hypothetical protein
MIWPADPATRSDNNRQRLAVIHRAELARAFKAGPFKGGIDYLRFWVGMTRAGADDLEIETTIRKIADERTRTAQRGRPSKYWAKTGPAQRSRAVP